MTTQHTPGPWRLERAGPCVYVMAGRFCVATTSDERGGGVPPAMDNARLIAAAPEMLAALRLALTALDHDDATRVEIAAYDMVCAAIAKAEGKT